jgi:anti-sigma B factor antagonist
MPGLNHHTSGNVLVIQLANPRILDQQVIDQIGSELKELLEKTENERVVLDFRQVQFMSSAMLGALVKFRKQCAEFKADLKLCGISKDIMEVFKVTNLHKVFDIQADEPTAVAAFDKKKGWFS